MFGLSRTRNGTQALNTLFMIEMFKIFFMPFKIFLFLISLSCLEAVADIKSNNGIIKFDTNADNSAEMSLTQTGLGIGVNPSSNLHINGNAIIRQSLSIGSSGSSNLSITGTIGHNFQSVSSNTTISDYSFIFADSSSDNLILTLPSASLSTGKTFYVKKTHTDNQLWVSASDNIENYESEIEMTQPSSGLSFLKIISDGSQWLIINQSDDILKVIGSANLSTWIKFDETSGTSALDSSHGQQTIDLLGGISFSSDSTTGVFDRALAFVGTTTDRVEISDHNSITFPNELTISCWLKPNNLNDGQIVRKNNEYLWRLNSNGTILARIFINGGWTGSLNSASTYNVSEWNHLVMRWDGSVITQFINGQLDANTQAAVGTINGTANNAVLGRYTSSSFISDGDLDDYKMFNRALSDTEITELYQKGL